MKRLAARHPLLIIVILASLWLLAGFVLIDQRWRYPYDDGSWGTMYFFGQALANLILLPGFSVADAFGPHVEPFTRWLIATVASVAIALAADRVVRKFLARRRVETV